MLALLVRQENLARRLEQRVKPSAVKNALWGGMQMRTLCQNFLAAIYARQGSLPTKSRAELNALIAARENIPTLKECPLASIAEPRLFPVNQEKRVAQNV